MLIIILVRFETFLTGGGAAETCASFFSDRDSVFITGFGA
jgi:hypothetical protein